MPAICLDCRSRNVYTGSLTRPRIICNDGVSLSVQANASAYCEPRENDADYYTLVEVGFIKEVDDTEIAPPDTWAEYTDGEFPNDVYGYVPVKLVEEFIAVHGGRKFFT